MLVGRGDGVKSVGVLPPHLPKGILYSSQFRSHQEAKMVSDNRHLRSHGKIGDCEQSRLDTASQYICELKNCTLLSIFILV